MRRQETPGLLMRLPLFLLIWGVMSLAMYIPASHAVVMDDHPASRAFFYTGTLGLITVTLIALAIGVAKQCDGCIGFHTKALKRLGATDEEVSETLGMTVYMGGGPSLMYAGDAWTAWQALIEG